MTDEDLSVLGRYEAMFGGEQLDSISAPNYVLQAPFMAALREAIRTGKPVTVEQLEPLLGPPAWEMMPGQ